MNSNKSYDDVICTLNTKVWFQSSLNHHHDVLRYVKIKTGIITTIYSHMNHSYDAKWRVKVMSEIKTMIDSHMNHSLLPTDV